MPRVLVVDDESSMRFLLRVTFEMEGFEVDEAPNGLVAIQEIENSRPPDLVATDFMMPLMNGGEFIARLRANPATADLPVILVSASPGSERKTEADAFFRKPFSSKELGECAAKLIERRGR